MDRVWTDISRSIDGIVGRLVDWFGNAPTHARPAEPAGAGAARQRWSDGAGETLAADRVGLVRYTVLNLSDGAATVVAHDQILVRGPKTKHEITGWILDNLKRPDSGESQAGGERIFFKVLRHWPRVPGPQPGKPSGEAASKIAGGLDARVLDALEKSDGLAMRDLARQTDESSPKLRRVLQKLMALGSVERLGEGLRTRYRRVKPGGSDE